jgi:phenylacetate-CoA ligase
MFVLEIADPETVTPVPEGERGTILITTLYKEYAPQIRFNVNDISAFATTPSPCGGTHRRLQRIYGRADNMVKLRGVNIFPEAIGALIAEDKRTTGEYFCIAEYAGAERREQMTVLVEVTDASIDKAALTQDAERRLHEALGLKITVQPMDRGALDAYTGTSQTSKIKRLLDKRKSFLAGALPPNGLPGQARQ